MKSEDLQALNLNEEQISKVLDLSNAELDKQQQTIQTLKTQKSTLETQLGQANQTLEGYDPEWKTKAAQATQDAEQKVQAMQREFALKEQVASLQFSSESAKKAFLSDLSAKELPLQEGKLLGFDDFVKTYQQSDPAAFAAQQSTPPPPRFSASATGATSNAGTERDQANAALRAAFGTQF